MRANELKECVIATGPIQGCKGRESFVCKVSFLLRLGYVPLGTPVYGKNTATLTLIKHPLEPSE